MPNSYATPETIRLATLILAAGSSSRMGSPKLLLPWGNSTVLEHLARTWKNLGVLQMAIVCTSSSKSLLAELDRIGFPAKDRIFNPNPELGMFSSIQCAASWKDWDNFLTHWIISLGDQPHIRTSTLQALLNFSAEHPNAICQPSRNGRPRHPIVLPKNIFTQLAATPGPTLKDFLNARAAERKLIEIDDPGLDLDLDSPADYERARELFCR